MPLNTWNTSGLQENVFGVHFSASTPHRSETDGIAERAVPRIKQGTSAVLLLTGLDDGQSAEFCGWTAKTADLGTTFQQIPCISYILMLEDKIRNPGKFLFRFSLGSNVMGHRSGDGPFSGCFEKSSRSIEGKDFPNFEMQDARIASALNKIIQSSQFKKKVSLEEQKAQKEDQFLRGRQIAYMIYDYFQVTGAHDTVLGYADLFSVSLRNDDVQDFDTKWDEILISRPRSHRIMFWTVCRN